MYDEYQCVGSRRVCHLNTYPPRKIATYDVFSGGVGVQVVVHVL
jgi:hypothetical protein